MTYTSNLPGNIQHGPGVVCIVKVPANIDPIALRNSGKLVVIQHEVFPGSSYMCGCGRLYRGRELLRPQETMWSVAGNLWCGTYYFDRIEVIEVAHRQFPQSWLVPIADPQTWEQLLKEEIATEEALEEFVKLWTTEE